MGRSRKISAVICSPIRQIRRKKGVSVQKVVENAGIPRSSYYSQLITCTAF